MSTATPVDQVAVPAPGVEGDKEIAVITPDVIEEPKPAESSNDIKTTNVLTPAAPLAETATTPALELAESAPPVDDAAVVKPAFVESSSPAVTDSAVEAPISSTGPGEVPAAVATDAEGSKDAKDVKNEEAKKSKSERKAKKSLLSRLSGIFSFHGEGKSASGTSSSSSSDGEHPSPAKQSARALPKTTVTPATPSKETTPITASVDAGVGSSSTAVPVPEASVPDVLPKTDAADDIAAEVANIKLEDKEVEKPVVVKDTSEPVGVEDVKETHNVSEAVPAVKSGEVPAPVGGKKKTEGKEKLSPSASPNPKIHRRISARIGQFIDHHKKKTGPASVPASSSVEGKIKDVESFVSGSAEVPAGADAQTVGQGGANLAPVLGEPVKVEPMGDILPSKPSKEDVEEDAAVKAVVGV